jgi:hypothetical protein
MDPRTLATTNPPATPAWEELGRLLDRRGELAARIDDLERQQGQANADAAKAAAAVADAERAALAGEDVPDTKKLDAALSRARSRAAEPWAERRDGARRALADHDAAIQCFTVEKYADLQAGLRAEGEAVTRAVDQAAADLVAAHTEWEHVASRMTALASSIRPQRPGDWTYSRAERAAAEAGRLLDNGGEVVPDVADPTKPRHSQPDEDVVPA